MILSSERILYLLNRAGDLTATAAEQQELTNWFAENDDDGSFQLYVETLLETHKHAKPGNISWDRIFAEIQAKKEVPHPTPAPSLRFLKTTSKPQPSHVALRWAKYAAAIIIVFGVATYLWNSQNTQPRPTVNSIVTTDINPGGERATLTLADGRTIILDATTDGTVAKEHNAEVIKLANGEIGYRTLKGNTAQTEITYNIMSTPKGGQYKIRLSDGTQVWLNAASSIRFPTNFPANERLVEITGEVYFEVAPDKQKPFIVSADSKTRIQVLGTRFNVNAYADDQAIHTTLLEGSVKVQYALVSQVLKPGQQASINRDNKILVTDNTDAEEVMAWKNGNFYFNNTELRTVMNQLDRWYDVNVVFKDNVENERIRAIIPRNIPISKLIHKLSLTGKINYRIEGKTIYITK